MHLQELYQGCSRYGGAVAESLFAEGICLPSSSSLTSEEQQYIVNVVREAAGYSKASTSMMAMMR
jgi:pyridoxal phosphate-dependent aminotransferase EpsN